MNDPQPTVPPLLLVAGGVVLTALGLVAVAAFAGAKVETTSELVDRLVAESLRRGDRLHVYQTGR